MNSMKWKNLSESMRKLRASSEYRASENVVIYVNFKTKTVTARLYVLNKEK
jgi:hypothetical protein